MSFLYSYFFSHNVEQSVVDVPVKEEEMYERKYPHVEPICSHGKCAHWLTDKYDSVPVLVEGKCIAEEYSQAYNNCSADLKCHLSLATEYADITPYEWNKLQSTIPKTNVSPLNTDNVKCHTQIVGDLQVDVKYNLIGDCWSLYTRDSQHRPRTTYFHIKAEDVETFYENNPHSDWWESDEYKASNTEQIKKKLIENCQDLTDDLNNGLTVCFSFGIDSFLNIYYQKIGEHIVCTEVRNRGQ